MKYMSIEKIKRAADNRPAGYVEFVLSRAAWVDGDRAYFRDFDITSLAALYAKHGPPLPVRRAQRVETARDRLIREEKQTPGGCAGCGDKTADK